MTAPRRDFARVGSLIKDVLRGIGPPAGERVQRLADVWRETVGEEIAELTRVHAPSHQSVEIEASSSAVLAEVRQFHCARFLERLKEKGIGGVERIACRLADG